MCLGKIEAGKYYRTRDGRKVGTTIEEGNDEYRWNVRWDEGPYYYSNDGKSCVGDDEDNLISEWADEQETPHFTHMLADMQGLAESYGYTIDGVATCDDTMAIDLILTK